mgnify:CR=1 FL=1
MYSEILNIGEKKDYLFLGFEHRWGGKAVGEVPITCRRRPKLMIIVETFETIVFGLAARRRRKFLRFYKTKMLWKQLWNTIFVKDSELGGQIFV